MTELADVLCQKQPGRLDAREISIFDSVGFALNDFSSLRYLHRLNRELGGVDVIDLIPALGDPKDLFGGLVQRRIRRDARGARPNARAGDGRSIGGAPASRATASRCANEETLA